MKKVLILLFVFVSSIVIGCAKDEKIPNDINIPKDNTPFNSHEIFDLTPNEVFFSPCGKLRNVAKVGQVGAEVNQGKVFEYIDNWRNVTDTLVWGVDILSSGSLMITSYLGSPESQNGSEIELIIDNEKHTFIISNAEGYNTYKKQGVVSFSIPKPGRYTIKMKIKSAKTAGVNVANVKKLELSGVACNGIKPVILYNTPYF